MHTERLFNEVLATQEQELGRIRRPSTGSARRLSPLGYAAIVKEILDVAHECCDGKMVFSLEGGYDLAGLEESIVSVLEVITGRSPVTEAAPSESALSELVDSISRVHGDF